MTRDIKAAEGFFRGCFTTLATASSVDLPFPTEVPLEAVVSWRCKDMAVQTIGGRVHGLTCVSTRAQSVCLCCAGGPLPTHRRFLASSLQLRSIVELVPPRPRQRSAH
jgi:hypothetical protein